MHSLAARCALALALAAAPLAPCAARAATFTVNSAADTSDGSCSPAAGGCTLREAIESSVATAGRDTVRFDPAVFPPGAPVVVQLGTVLPAIEDAAGTAIDGTGAGVIVEPGPGVGAPSDPFLFTSGTAPLAGAAVSNLMLRGFDGTAIQICGGMWPGCSQDVAGAVVRNVVVQGNGGAGIRVTGGALTGTRLENVVAAANAGRGIDCSAASLLGLRVSGAALRANGSDGLYLHATESASGNAVADTVASGNGGVGVLLQSDQQLVGSRLSNVTADSNMGTGISLSGATQSDSLAERIVTAHNGDRGIAFVGAADKIALREISATRNAADGVVIDTSGELTGLSISDAQAADNHEDGIEVADHVRGARIADVFLVGNAGDGLDIGGQEVADSRIERVRASGNQANGIYLVAPAGGGNTIRDCALHANFQNGLRVIAGNTGNVIQRNVALGSTLPDLRDDNATCVNSWTEDVFGSSDGPCIQ